MILKRNVDSSIHIRHNKTLSSGHNFCFAVTGTVSASEERVQVALEELQNLKGVWSELQIILYKDDMKYD